MRRQKPQSIGRVQPIWRSFVLVAVLALIPAAPAVSADETPPAPTVNATVQFVLGSTVEPSYAGCSEGYVEVPAVLSVEISRFEASGSWAVSGNYFDLARGEVWEPDVVAATTYPHVVTNYDGTCGGGSVTLNEWYIETSASGEPAPTWLSVNAWVTIFDEDGKDLSRNWPDADIVAKGRWHNSYCDCWLGGTVLRTRQRGARMTYTAEVLEGEIIAIVMPMAPNRGEARIKLDGVNQGRIDTYSETRDNRIVMWQTPPLEAGVHTVKIINLATEGRPRIDVDAFLAKTGGVGD